LIRAALADYLPAANGRLIAAKTCLYTMTPDGDFLIDRLCPAHPVSSSLRPARVTDSNSRR
jgi:glycine/D-amino acid oxidase-like deaminating enzyme